MSSTNIIFATICWICSLGFGAIALWAFKRKTPMHFWSGSTVRPEEIADIPSYNRANGFMWTIYTICVVVAGALSLFSIKIGVILLLIVSVPGLVALIVTYNWIYNKYRSTSINYKTGASRPKMPKAVFISKISISAVILIAVVSLFFYGEKDPVANVLDDHIQIKSMYGLNIDFNEIAEISLIEKSVNDIGVGTRTNGYGGIGGTLKGHFVSDTLGQTLLFVQSKSSPTIKIGRTGKKDVYISFRNSESTEQFYRELIANIPLK